LLDWKKFGFTSLVEFLKSMPHLVILLPTGTGTYKLVPNKSSDCLKIERQILRQSKESLEEIERQISSRIDGEEEQIDWGTASNACKVCFIYILRFYSINKYLFVRKIFTLKLKINL
jgi:hypothetical protein